MYTSKLIFEGLDKTKPIFFDTETLGLYGRTRLVQVRQGKIAYEYDCFFVNIEDLKFWLKDCHLVIHNAHYDLSCRDFQNWIPAKLDCTLYLSRIQWPELTSHSLASLSSQFLSREKTEEGKSDWGEYALTEEQLKYANIDTLLVEQLWQKISEETKDSPAYKLNVEALLVSLEIQNKGMKTNHKTLLGEKRKYQKEIKRLTDLLPEGLNVNSPKQVKQYLNVGSSAKGELYKLNNENCDNILKLREATKALTFIELFNKYDFIYSFTNPSGAKTGRATSKGCELYEDRTNLQQIPKYLKKGFGVSNGSYYVTADYPALEIRTTCAHYDDDFLYDALKNNKQLHNETCIRMYGKGKEELSESQYVAAKSCNFSLLYGAGPKGLYEMFNTRGFRISEEECKELVYKWWGIYKGIARKRAEAIQYFQSHSFRIARTGLGYPIRCNSFTEYLSAAPQGTGAECTKLALVLLKKKCSIIPVNSVHDSIACIARNEKEATEMAQAIKWAMEESFRRVTRNCLHNDIPCEVETYIGEDYK